MQQVLKQTTALLLAILLGGCASADSKPDWLNGESERYPHNEYLIGSGSGDDAAIAKDRARAEIAKVFEVTVRARSSSKERVRFNSADNSETIEADLSQSLSSESNRIISGIEIADLWYDDDLNIHHALAILKRSKARRSLRQQIQSLDEATERYLGAADNESEALVGIALAANAIELQKQRADLQKSLRVVSISGRGEEPRWTVAGLEAGNRERLHKIRVAIEADAALTPLMSEAISAVGLVGTQASEADYLFKGNMQSTDLGKRDGWFWFRGNISVELTGNNGHSYFKKSWPLKASSSVSREAAQAKLRQQAGDKLKAQLYPALTGLAD